MLWAVFFFNLFENICMCVYGDSVLLFFPQGRSIHLISTNGVPIILKPAFWIEGFTSGVNLKYHFLHVTQEGAINCEDVCVCLCAGYRISWEEFNRTNTRVTHYLPNVTLEYRVTGLTALTTYTIEVAAMTSKGQGQLSSSTISSGVPPGTHTDIHVWMGGAVYVTVGGI